MDISLLRSWLELPSDEWPPDYYVLLNLEPSNASSELIESRVLERMEKLRHHQLLHPELVTEGMNLLAQAMLCLTDPQSRRQYDHDQGLNLDGRNSTYQLSDESHFDSLEPPKDSETRTVEEPSPPPPPRSAPLPKILSLPLPIEIVFDPEDESEFGKLPREIGQANKSQTELDSLPLLEESKASPVYSLDPGNDSPADSKDDDEEEYYNDNYYNLTPTRAPQREDRRRLYADLVRIRRVLNIIDALRQLLDDPSKTFSRRTETVEFMNYLAELRPLWPSVSDLIGTHNQPGSIIAVMSRQQLVVEMFRSLLPSQCEALAQDCRAAFAVLRDRYSFLRHEARWRNRKGIGRSYLYPMAHRFKEHPDWLFLVLGLTSLILALVRSI